MYSLNLPSPLEPLDLPLFRQKGVSIYIKRDDLIHPTLSGNKWRKLRGALNYCQESAITEIRSFGGAYSNHLHALAFAGHYNRLRTMAWVRADAIDQDNATLQDCLRWGMEIELMDRKTYRRMQSPQEIAKLQRTYHQSLVLPEGGSSAFALEGMSELASELNNRGDVLMLPVGSGGTFSALLPYLQGYNEVIGVSVLKGISWNEKIPSLLAQFDQKAHCKWQVLEQYHAGGYAKFSHELVSFIQNIKQATSISFEPIYSGKVFWALYDLISKDYFAANTRIIFLHTGGLQGLRGLASQSRISPAAYQQLKL